MSMPPLGSLPLERHVLSQWTTKAELDAEQRRHYLAAAFTQLGDEARSPYLSNIPPPNAPHESEWQAILSPLRTEAQRRYALPSSFHPEGFENFGTLWLRTCYSGAERDDQHAALLDTLNTELALEVDANLLNDHTLYDYGSNWHRIFDVMPERLFRQAAVPGHAAAAPPPGIVEAARERDLACPDLQRAFSAEHPDDGDAAAAGLDADEYRSASEALHARAIVGYLFVADETALETGEALVVFFDDRGRTVRQARIRPELCEDTAGAWADGLLRELPEFSEGEVGQDYQPGGVCGPPFKEVQDDTE